MALRAAPGGSFLLASQGGKLLTRAPVVPFSNYVLAQSWEFTGGATLLPSLNGRQDAWTPRYNNTPSDYNPANGLSHLNDELEGYPNPFFSAAYAANPTLIGADGEVLLRAMPTPSALKTANGGTVPYDYISGCMTTARGFSQRYGFFEARVKIPAGAGMWPAFWMLPTDFSAPPEIDIFEILPGLYPNTVYCTYHWGTNYTTNHGVDETACSTWADGTPLPVLSDDYHEYALDWTSTKLDWYLDRKLLVSKTIASAALPQYQKPFYLLLNLAIGGGWPGPPSPSQVWPVDMHVDWVRAWRLP